jgi:hypothetical protein
MNTYQLHLPATIPATNYLELYMPENVLFDDTENESDSQINVSDKEVVSRKRVPHD